MRVLSNACRHRSSVILEGAGNAKNFVCPYHAWTYANDGQLLRAPYMNKVKGFDVKDCRLPEFATEVWHGFLYVNLDGKAKPLAPRLKGLEPYLANRHPEDMVVNVVLDEVWPTNWKCLAENYMEGYHLSSVHHAPRTTKLCTISRRPGSARRSHRERDIQAASRTTPAGHHSGSPTIPN